MADEQAREFVIDKQWVVKRRLGTGGFGDTFLVKNKRTRTYAAAKFENLCQTHRVLRGEYKTLQDLKIEVGLPAVYWLGLDGVQNRYLVMVMEALGPSLADIQYYCHNKLSVKAVVMLADQMIKIIEALHGYGIVHRDLKPGNFVMGERQNMNTLYLIDFGLSKQYKNQRLRGNNWNFEHVIGTARYCSIKSHTTAALSRRDDIESIAYVIVYLLTGTLPWTGLENEHKHSLYREIYEAKRDLDAPKMCENLPQEILKFVNYSRNLSYVNDPDYALIRRFFWNILLRKRAKFDWKFDWLRLTTRE